MTVAAREDGMTRRPIAWILALGLLLVVTSGVMLIAHNKRDIAVSAKKYTYVVDGAGAEIRVKKDDLVTITLTAQDIAHSFTISDDHYRIDRRAEPGKPVTFSFRADKPGEFEIRCTLTVDERCA